LSTNLKIELATPSVPEFAENAKQPVILLTLAGQTLRQLGIEVQC
jgi:hypothetical protein